jgi:hypothetical protein
MFRSLCSASLALLLMASGVSAGVFHSAYSATRQSTGIPGTPLGGIDFANPDWKSASHVLREGAWQPLNYPLKSVSDSTRQVGGKVLKATYPINSSSPASHRNYGTPLGGGQFAADFNLTPRRSMGLDYYVYFPSGFAFNKGGKLPGLYGGSVSSASGGRTAADSFSTRIMWRKGGMGELYAYFPNSKAENLGISYGDGISIGRGSFYFKPGTWTHIRQVVKFTGAQTGSIQLWVNDMQTPVINIQNATLGTSKPLAVSGLFFSTFFGGSDASWGSPKSQYALFTGFTVWEP